MTGVFISFVNRDRGTQLPASLPEHRIFLGRLSMLKARNNKAKLAQFRRLPFDKIGYLCSNHLDTNYLS